MSVIITEVTTFYEIGKEAQTADLFCNLANSFSADITCQISNNTKFDPKKLHQVIKAKVKPNQTIMISAIGNDANAAVDALADLIKNNFSD